MPTVSRSPSPMILLRISNGAYHMHRPFNDFLQAMQSAEAFAGAGFAVAMVSATGQFLMGFEPKVPRVSVPSRPAPKPCQYA